MVDFFLVLMLPNAGDELQGIKRGIMELADALVINKADGEGIAPARSTRRHYENALKLFTRGGFWVPPVLCCSALEGSGIAEVWSMVNDYRRRAEREGQFDLKRARQNAAWLRRLLRELLEQRFRGNQQVRVQLPLLEEQVMRGEITPYAAAMQLVAME